MKIAIKSVELDPSLPQQTFTVLDVWEQMNTARYNEVTNKIEFLYVVAWDFENAEEPQPQNTIERTAVLVEPGAEYPVLVDDQGYSDLRYQGTVKLPDGRSLCVIVYNNL